MVVVIANVIIIRKNNPPFLGDLAILYSSYSRRCLQNGEGYFYDFVLLSEPLNHFIWIYSITSTFIYH